jgi:hypothetical protein
VNWLAGDDVMFVWLGQKVSDQVGSSPSVFGYESATVVAADRTGTPNDQFATTFATNTTDPVANNNANISTALPFNWDDAVMGAAPTVGIP